VHKEKAVDKTGSPPSTAADGAGSSAWMELADFNDNASSH